MAGTVEPGSSVSHYRVIGPLGAGGMGEVYKAQDVTLERTVALKILPPDLVRNEERVRRFVQEAKSASSLNHPNIVTIHEIGQDGSIHYIAMELVDGSTLKRKIHEEQTDLRTLIQYLAQAADGLAKAHGAGIVHRDLKPENVMVTRDGFAKVLDFGLAKLSVKKSASEATNEATEVRHATREGAVMGTVAYMSPEQVQGRVVDPRSDIFSFGCILYEAATRRRPFDADSDVDVMHKILHDKPQPVDEINPAVPAEVRRMIRRCMAKDPDKRYQSMKDVAIELADIVEEFEELSASATSAGSGSGAVVPVPAQRPVGWIIATVLGVLLVAAGIYLWRGARTIAAPPAAFQSMKIQRLTSTAGFITDATISPDGKYLAYIVRDAAGKFGLWVRQIATGSDVQVVPPMKTGFPGFAFSPDGNYLFYVNSEFESGGGYSWLYQVPSLGGTPRKLLFDIDTAPAFSPDGKQVVFERGEPGKKVNHLVVANIDGSGQRILMTRPELGGRITPSWSPDGKRVSSLRGEVAGGLHVAPVTVDVATGKEQPIGSKRWRYISDMHWLPDGHELLIIAGTEEIRRPQIYLQPYPDGTPARVTNDTNIYGGLSLTADGNTFATIRFENTNEIRLTDPSDPTLGKELPRPATALDTGWVSVARNGAIVYQFGTDKGTDLAILDNPEAQPRVLTDTGNNFSASITADGKTIVFTSRRIGDTPHVFAIDADGSNLRQLTRGSGEGGAYISPDGQTIVYNSIDSKLMKMNTAGGQATQLADRFNGGGAISPDGTKVVYGYIQHAVPRELIRIRVASLAGGPPLLDTEWQYGGPYRWSSRNDGFTFMKRADGATNIFLQPLNGGAPVQITHFKKGYIGGYDWTADGKLVMTRGDQRSEMILVSSFR